MRPALAEDDVTRDNEFGVGFLGSETLSRTGRGFVRTTLTCMGGRAGIRRRGFEGRWEVEDWSLGERCDEGSRTI